MHYPARFDYAARFVRIGNHSIALASIEYVHHHSPNRVTVRTANGMVFYFEGAEAAALEEYLRSRTDRPDVWSEDDEIGLGPLAEPIAANGQAEPTTP